PGAVALGPDGSLYASMTANSNILRIHTPEGPSQTVDSMATTLSGTPARGLAIIGSQLWVADRDGIFLLPDPVGCGTKCRGVLNTQLGIVAPLSVTYDSTNTLAYIGTAGGVYRYNPNTGIVDLYSATYVRNGVPGQYSFVPALGTDA